MGTTGTMMGTGGYLKERNPAITLVGVQPDSPFHGLEGLKHLATTTQPPALYDPAVPDVVAEIATETADRTARWLARSAGYLVGWSAGAAVAAAIDIVRREPDACVVVIGCDTGAPLPERAPPVGGVVTLRLTGALADEIRRHGESAYPAECCGVLVGRVDGRGEGGRAAGAGGEPPDRRPPPLSDRAGRSSPARGRAARGRARRSWATITRTPIIPPRPRRSIPTHAWPWYSYLIVRIDRGRGAELASWVLDDDRPPMQPESLDVFSEV